MKQKKRYGCLIPILIVLILLVVLTICVAVGVSSSVQTTPQSLLASQMELDETQEAAITEIFDACGICEIKDCTMVQAGETHTSYYVEDDETEHYTGAENTIVVWLDNETKTVESIYFDDHDIYVDGATVAQVSDYYVSSALRDTYRANAQTIIKQCLNYPDTAEFKSASYWHYGVSDDGYDIILSSVTAQNAFGVESTEEFQILIDRGTGNAVSVILGGTEYIK